MIRHARFVHQHPYLFTHTYDLFCLPTCCPFITHMWFPDCQTTPQSTWSVKLNTRRIFLKDVLRKIEMLTHPNLLWEHQHKCKTWMQLGRLQFVCVCGCIRVDGGYFIGIASSYGNNLDFFSLFLLKWAELWMFYKWGLVHWTGSLWHDMSQGSWVISLLVSIGSKLRLASFKNVRTKSEFFRWLPTVTAGGPQLHVESGLTSPNICRNTTTEYGVN